MKFLRLPSQSPARWAVILLLVLASCNGVPLVPSVTTEGAPAALMTQAENRAENQLAADAGVKRANAQATLVAAESTQSVALAQDAIQQGQLAHQATAAAQAVQIQHIVDGMAAGTRTAVAQDMAAEAAGPAAATSVWSTTQGPQRAEQRRGPVGFFLTWCWPSLLVLVAGLAVWGLWRWLTLRQAKQQIFNELLDELPAPPTTAQPPPAPSNTSYTESNAAESRYELTEPEDQVQRWLGEVKDKLQGSDEKDENDGADS